MKYYLHDSNALQDEKIAELYMTYGYEGYGLFFAILEKLAAQEKPIKTAVLKKQLDVGKRLEKCWSFLEEIGLICSSNGETSNVRIISYVQTFGKQKEKNRERTAQWRENQQHPENVTDTESIRNAPNSIVNNSIVNNNTITDASASDELALFERFWEVYDKKQDRKKCLAKWRRLKPEERQAILMNVVEYVKIHDNPNYRKNPLTYLTGECWKDPLKASTNQSGKQKRLIV